MRSRAHEDARRVVRRHRRQQRRRGYISPYHESPVDLDKYDDEMGKLNADATTCWTEDYGQQCEVAEATKKLKNGKRYSRPLATGCAANFEIFGPPRMAPFWG